jgi:uncharacterized protein YlxW (UPF0749 family)
MAVTTAETPTTVDQRSSAATPRHQTWIWQVTGLCVVLGVLLGLALRAQWHFRRSELPGSRYSTLAPFYLGLKQANDRLQKEVTDLRRQTSAFEQNLATESQAAKVLNTQLQELKMFAGLAPVKGPGLEISLRDSPRQGMLGKLGLGKPGSGVDESETRIHDQDINAVVSELKAAGAEAIAIAGADKTQLQRVTALTTARCAGPGVKVNDAVFGAPYTIFAIGNPKDLESQLRLPSGVLDQSGLETLDMIRIVHRDQLTIPGYSGSIAFRSARATE